MEVEKYCLVATCAAIGAGTNRVAFHDDADERADYIPRQEYYCLSFLFYPFDRVYSSVSSV